MIEDFSCDCEQVFNIKIGYTQGELQEGDYIDDGFFKAGNNVIWRFTVFVDFDRSFKVYDWDLSRGSIYIFDDDESLSKGLASMLEKKSGEDNLFGREIIDSAFESVLQYSFDPDLGSYPCSNEVLERIGGDLYLEEDADAIPGEYVNSLFSLKEVLPYEEVSIVNGKLYLDGDIFEINEEGCRPVEQFVVGFTNDVMCYQ